MAGEWHLTNEEMRQALGIKPERTFGGTMKDIGVTLGNAAIGAGESVVGLANLATGGLAGKAMNALGYDPKAAREFLGQYYSDAQKAANREVDEAKGFWDTAGAMLRNPSTIAATAVESAPSMFIGGGIGGKLLGAATGRLAKAAEAGSKSAAKYFERNAAGQLLRDRSGQLMLSEAGRKTLGRTAAAVGEGAVAGGALAEQMRQENADKELTGRQALYAGLGGALTGGIGRLGSGVANRMGVTDVDTLLTTGLRGAAQEGGKRLTAGQIARGIGAGALTESVFEELPQSMQEEIWTNLAAGRPWNENVGKAGAQGMMTGFLMGAGANVRTGMPGAQREILEAQAAQERARMDALGRSLYSRPDAVPSTQAGLDAMQAARNAEAAARAAGAQARLGYSGVVGKALAAASNGAPTSEADSAFATLPTTLPTPGDSALEAQGDERTRRQRVGEYLGERRDRRAAQPETDAQRIAREQAELELARNTPWGGTVARAEAELAQARRTATTREEIRAAEDNLRMVVELSRPDWENAQQVQEQERLRQMDALAAAGEEQERLYGMRPEVERLRNALTGVRAQQAQQEEAARRSGVEERYAQDHGLNYTGDTTVPAGSLVRGDKVQVRDEQGRPDVATVRGYTDDGRVILQDGVRMTFGEDEDVPIQGISLNEHAGRQQQGWGFKTKAERERLKEQKYQRKAVDAIFREEEKRRRQEEAEQRERWIEEHPAPTGRGDSALAAQGRNRTPEQLQAEAEHDARMQQPAPPPKPETKTARQAREKAELEQAKAVSPEWAKRLSRTQDAIRQARKDGDKEAEQRLQEQLRGGVRNALAMAKARTQRQAANDEQQRLARMDRQALEHDEKLDQYLRQQWNDLTRASVLPDFARNVGGNRVPTRGQAQDVENTNAAEVEDALNLFMLAAVSDEQRAQVSATRDALARQPRNAEEAQWQRALRARLATAGRAMREEMRRREARRLPASQPGRSEAREERTPTRTRTRTQSQAKQETPKQIEYKPQPTYPGEAVIPQGQQGGFGFRPASQRQAQQQALLPLLPPQERRTPPAYPGRPQAPALPRNERTTEATQERQPPAMPRQNPSLQRAMQVTRQGKEEKQQEAPPSQNVTQASQAIEQGYRERYGNEAWENHGKGHIVIAGMPEIKPAEAPRKQAEKQAEQAKRKPTTTEGNELLSKRRWTKPKKGVFNTGRFYGDGYWYIAVKLNDGGYDGYSNGHVAFFNFFPDAALEEKNTGHDEYSVDVTGPRDDGSVMVRIGVKASDRAHRYGNELFYRGVTEANKDDGYVSAVFEQAEIGKDGWPVTVNDAYLNAIMYYAQQVHGRDVHVRLLQEDSVSGNIPSNSGGIIVLANDTPFAMIAPTRNKESLSKLIGNREAPAEQAPAKAEEPAEQKPASGVTQENFFAVLDHSRQVINSVGTTYVVQSMASRTGAYHVFAITKDGRREQLNKKGLSREAAKQLAWETSEEERTGLREIAKDVRPLGWDEIGEAPVGTELQRGSQVYRKLKVGQWGRKGPNDTWYPLDYMGNLEQEKEWERRNPKEAARTRDPKYPYMTAYEQRHDIQRPYYDSEVEAMQDWGLPRLREHQNSKEYFIVSLKRLSYADVNSDGSVTVNIRNRAEDNKYELSLSDLRKDSSKTRKVIGVYATKDEAISAAVALVPRFAETTEQAGTETRATQYPAATGEATGEAGPSTVPQSDEIRDDGRPARREGESLPEYNERYQEWAEGGRKTKAEQELAGMSDADIEALVNEVATEMEAGTAPPTKKPGKPRAKSTTSSTKKPTAKKSTTKTGAKKTAGQKTAKQIAAEGGIAAIDAVKEATEGLRKLFAGKGMLGSGLVFDEETYREAKPHFVRAWQAVKQVGYSAKELIQYFLSEFGGAQTRPYVIRFMQDLRDGNLEIQEENNGAQTEREAVDGTAVQEPLRQDGDGLETDRPGALETVPAEVGGLDERGDAGVRGVGGGRENAQGDSGTDAQGSAVPRGGSNGEGEVRPGQAEGKRGGRRGNVKASAETTDPNQTSSPTAIPAANFAITPELELGKGGPVAKYNDNIAAIRTLKQIQAEGRRATPEEQAVLAKYVGWGGLADAFRNAQTGKVKEGWEKRVEELEALLTPEELQTARNSTQNAHYTSQDVVSAIWHGMRRLGFQGGNVLEPSVGTGNFLGLMPQELAGTTHFTAAEFDGITAGIAKLLYPNENIRHSPFEKLPLVHGAMDAMVGNPPFGSTSLTFLNVAGINGFSIHNQFVLASLDALKPGGVMGFVVSHHLMDSATTEVRKRIADQAKLLGAIRLPGTAFLENARTEVVTDIIFLQKNTVKEQEAWDAIDPKERSYPDWVETSPALGGELGKDGEPLAPININNWFVNHPARVLGKMNREGSMRQANELGVSYNGTDVAGDLKRIIDKMLPQNVVVNDIAKAEQVYAEMVTHMDLALAERQPGDVHINENGELEQVYERGSSVGEDELVLTTRMLTADSPWSRSLTQTADGRWYEMVDVLDEDGNPVKETKVKHVKGMPVVVQGKNIKEKKYYEEDEISSGKRLGKTKYERLKEAARLIDLVKEQVRMEADPKSTDAEIEAHRRRLAQAYEEYVNGDGTKKRQGHGFVNDPKTEQLVGDMPNGPMLLALEKSYTKKAGDRPAQAVKADILLKRVVFPYAAQARAENGGDALGVSLSESGRVDVKRIAALLGTDEQSAISELFDNAEQPLVFFDPEAKGWTSADDYLSGNVRRKLNAAIAARDAAQVSGDNELAARLDKGIEALERVQPEPWKADQITPVLGATWIPGEVYADFYNHLTGGQATVTHISAVGQFVVNVHEPGGKVGAWSTDERSAGYLLNAALSSKNVRVNTKDEEDEEGSSKFDPEATAAANDKIAEMREEFVNWAFQNAERRNRLVGIFNDLFNTRVNRQWDGSHLLLPGKVPDSIIKLRRHQMNAIWRGIVTPFVLYDHAVGAGKTFTGIARAMERKRMGLSRKPMIVVPNHLVNQFAADVYRLYPGAKVLAAGAADLARSKRRRMFGRIATGDWDIVIVPHSSFEFISIDPSNEMRFTQEALKEALDAKEILEEQEAGSFGKSPAVKSVEALITRLESRMEKLRARGREKDRLLTFEQMGVDDLTVDEAHMYKNLFYHSNVQASGMGQRSGSSRAYDLWTKVRTLRETGGAVAFMTGTPISNSAVEMHALMRYLAGDELKELGLEHFDSWRTLHVDISTTYEPTESGSGLREVTRMGREWSNMRPLIEMYYGFADCVTNEDIHKWYFEDYGKEFPLPRVKGGGRQNVNVQPTQEQERILNEVIHGFDTLRNIQDPIKRAAERLRLMNRARDVSLDAREVDPSIPAEEGGKISAVCDRVYEIYQRYDAVQGTQLIFLDRSVPQSKGDAKRLKSYDKALKAYAEAEAKGDDEAAQQAADALEKFNTSEMEAIRKALSGGWNAYQQIKDNLVAMGIPADEIRFVQDANTDQQKQDLFDAVKRGDVRVLIGSTQRMGAGTNVQDRLVALHHVDVTWKPSDIEQREGRIIRQGNLFATEPTADNPNPLYDPNFEVEILAYTTERTVDAKMWSLNAIKMRMINGIRKYDGSFNMEFDDTEAFSMAEIAAEASGDPLQLERVQLDSEITTLERQKRGFLRNKYALEDSIRQTEQDVANLPSEIEYFEEYGKIVERGLAEERTWKNQKLKVTIDGETYYGAFRDAAIEHVRETQAKARAAGEKFSVKINGVEYTALEKAESAVYAALGDASTFVGELDGQRFASQKEMRQHVAVLTTEAVAGMDRAEDVHIGTYKQGGLEFDLTVTVEPATTDKGERYKGVTFYFDQKVPKDAPQSYRSRRITLLYDGKFMENGKTVDPHSFLKMFHRLTSKITAITPTRIEELKRRLEQARESLPELKKQQKAEWPKQKQLDEKKARLAQVEQQLNAQAVAAERGVRMNAGLDIDGTPDALYQRRQTDEPRRENGRPARREGEELADYNKRYQAWREEQQKEEVITLFQEAWHGSPFRFDEFTLDNIGGGEGAQVHGWGLYFSLEPDVSQGYVDRLEDSSPTYNVNGRIVRLTNDGWQWDDGYMTPSGSAEDIALTALEEDYGDIDGALEKLRADKDSLEYSYEHDLYIEGDRESLLNEDEEYQKIIQAIAFFDENNVERTKSGQLYRVDIPEDAEMLREDANLADQPEQVREALKRLVEQHATSLKYVRLSERYGKGETTDFDKLQKALAGKADVSGRTLYDMLTLAFGSPKDASLALNEAGIRGIRYEGGLDGECAVVFDDTAVEILETYYQAQKDGKNPLEALKKLYGRKRAEAGQEAARQAEEVSGLFPHRNKGESLPDYMKRRKQWAEGRKEKLWNQVKEQIRNILPDKAQANAIIGIIEARAKSAGISAAEFVHRRGLEFKRGKTPGDMLAQGEKLQGAFNPRIYRDEGRAIISAFEAADVSTLAHELAHMFRQDLERFGQTELLKAAEKWAGVKDGKWTRKQEEMFARAFERYLREGKAPTKEMRGIFARFRDWLTNIYRVLKGSPLDVKLTPEITRVFDALLTENAALDRGDALGENQAAWWDANPAEGGNTVLYQTAANPAANNAVTGQSFVDRILANAKPKYQDMWERFIYNFIDNNDPRERVWKKAGSPTDQDFVTVERLRGKKTAAEQKKFREEMVTPLLKTLGEGGLAVSDLEEYAWALHTPERNQRMREVNAKRTLDELAKHMGDADRQNLKAQMEFISTQGAANGWTTSDIQQAYLDLMDDVFRNIAVREAALPNLPQRQRDAESRRIEETKKVRDRWNEESVRFAGQTDAEAQAVIDKWRRDNRFATLRRAQQQMADISAATLDVLHEAGELDDEEYQGMKNGYQYYVPLHRDGFLDTTPIRLLQVAKGSKRNVVNILPNVVRSHDTAIARKYKIEAGKALYDFAKAHPDAGITIEELEKKPTHDREGNIVMYTSQAEPEDGVFIRYGGRKMLLRFAADNRTMEGKTLGRFLDSVKGSDANLNGLIQMLHGVTRWLSAVNTTLNPEFVITNFSRDLQTAFIHLNQKDIDMDGLKRAVAHDIFPAMKGIFAAERGDRNTAMGRWYSDYEANGGKVGWAQNYEQAVEVAKEIEWELKLHQDGHHAYKAYRRMRDLVDHANASIENCMRLATYKNLVERGVSKQRAARIASGLTVDFTQHGKMSPQINALYMFANASVQGSVRMIQALASSKKVQAIAGGIAGAGFLLQMLALAGGGDDDSGEPNVLGIPEAIRERNIIIMVPGSDGKKYIKIPKAYGYGALYDFGAELANSIYMGAQGRKYDHAKGAMRVVSSFANSFNPIQSATMLQQLAPTLLDPLVYVSENKSWMGTPLMPEQNPYGPSKPDSERAWKGTSPIWKKTARIINDMTGGDKYQGGWADVSPETLSMVWDTASGGMGRFFGNVVSLPFSVAAGETEAHKVPFARQVYGEWNDRSISSRYYEVMDRAEIAHMRFRNAESLPERKRLYRTPDHQLYLQSRAAEKEIRALRKRQQAMEAAGNRDGAERIRTRIVAAQSKVLSSML